MKSLTLRRLTVLSLVMLMTFSIGSLGATSDGGTTTVTLTDVVTITATKGSNFAAITATELTGATINVTPAWTLQVDAITNYSVNAQLTAVSATGLTAAPVGSSLLIGATASGAGGTTAVASTAFSDTLSTNLSLDTAFSNVNNANGTGESSTIDLTLDLDKLGDRVAAETITYTLSFIVADTTP